MAAKETSRISNGSSSAAAAAAASTTMIDPKSFPQTEQGLASFLKEIDGPRPYDTANSNGTTTPDVTASCVYNATKIEVLAGYKKEIPIPILQSGSVVEWEIFVGEDDVDVSIVQQTPPDKPQPAVPICRVEKQRVYCNNNTETTETSSGKPQASGSFTVDVSPTSLLLVFDNTYSWYTPKFVSYKVSVEPPVEAALLERAERAKAALSKVLVSAVAAQEVVTKAEKRANKAQKSVDQRHAAAAQWETKLAERGAAQKQQEEAVAATEQKRQEAQTALAEQQARLATEEEQLAKLQQAIRDLEMEQKVRLEEKATLQEQIAQTATSLEQYTAQAQDQQALSDQTAADVQQLQADASADQTALATAQQEHDQAAAAQGAAVYALDFLERQADALRLRFV